MIGNCSSSGWRLSIPVILLWFCPDEYGLVVVALNHHYLSTTPPARLPDTCIFPTGKHGTASRSTSSDGDVVLRIRNPQQLPKENGISVHSSGHHTITKSFIIATTLRIGTGASSDFACISRMN